MIKNILTTLVLGACGISAMAQYQLPNSDFESDFVVAYKYQSKSITGKIKTTEYTEPLGWHGFATLYSPSFEGSARTDSKLTMSNDVRTTNNNTGSKHSVCIKSSVVDAVIIKVVANGVMTTGRINNLSANADVASENFNESNPNFSISDSERNTTGTKYPKIFYPENRNYAQTFKGKPDAMKVWVKFSPVKKEGYASVNAVIHNDLRYQDPEDKDYSSVIVAAAKNDKIAKYDEWQQLDIAFDYSLGNAETPKYILVSFTTNAIPASGSGGDCLYVDDIEMVYKHSVKEFKYDNTAIALSESSIAHVNSVYDPKKMKLTLDGVGASYTKNYNPETGVLTIKVLANNYEEDDTNFSEYKVQFLKSVSSVKFTEDLVVSVNADKTVMPAQDIYVYEMPDGSYTMSLKNFVLTAKDEESGAGVQIPIGNIVLTNLQGNNKNKILSFNESREIEIVAGDMEGVSEDEYMGPTLGLVPVVFSGKMAGNKFYCNIDIDMQESLEQTINVVFGKKIVPVTETAAVSAADAGYAHVVLDRAFNAGWNTICLPFTYTASEIAEGAEAQEFKADHGNWLTFDAVEGQLEPNKPYLIYVPTEVAAGKVFENKTIVAGTPASVSNGNFTFTGVYEQKDMNGSYGVATVDGKTMIFQGGTNSKIMGTRAYFECSDKSISSVGIAFNGEATSISTITAPAAAKATGVYNLQGIKLNNTGSTAGLPAGLYIVNGQKMLVK